MNKNRPIITAAHQRRIESIAERVGLGIIDEIESLCNLIAVNSDKKFEEYDPNNQDEWDDLVYSLKLTITAKILDQVKTDIRDFNI